MREELLMLESTGSTNDDALALGREGAPHGSAVAARLQTAGRGRRGHAWESPRGNLYLSVVLRPQVAPTRLPGLAAACGLGVLDGLKELGIANETQLKWPNDVLARGRKLAGILVEASRDNAGEPFAVCGVGVNVARTPRGMGAVCLAEFGAEPSLTELAEALRAGVARRAAEWASLPGELPLDGIVDEYEACLAWRGEKVRALAASDGTELARGVLEGVDRWGRAVVDGVAYASELASLRPIP